MKQLNDILAPLVAIADAFDANNLDDEARKYWGVTGDHQENTTPHDKIELYTGRGGGRLLTLAHCMDARAFANSVMMPVSSPAWQECAATGQSCSHGPHGPDGAEQCQYCGASPEPPKGFTRQELADMLDIVKDEDQKVDNGVFLQESTDGFFTRLLSTILEQGVPQLEPDAPRLAEPVAYITEAALSCLRSGSSGMYPIKAPKWRNDETTVALYVGHAPKRKFIIGDRVTKTSGSSWTGRVVGFYSTELTPIGYCVESETETGSVQIYPERALAPK